MLDSTSHLHHTVKKALRIVRVSFCFDSKRLSLAMASERLIFIGYHIYIIFGFKIRSSKVLYILLSLKPFVISLWISLSK